MTLINDISDAFSAGDKRGHYYLSLLGNCIQSPFPSQRDLRLALRYNVLMDRYLLQAGSEPEAKAKPILEYDQAHRVERNLRFSMKEIENLENETGAPPPKALAWKVCEAIKKWAKILEQERMEDLEDRLHHLLGKIDSYRFVSPDDSLRMMIEASTSFGGLFERLSNRKVLTHLGTLEFISALKKGIAIALSEDQTIPKDLTKRIVELSRGFLRVSGPSTNEEEPLRSMSEFYGYGSDNIALGELVILCGIESPHSQYPVVGLRNVLQRIDALHVGDRFNHPGYFMLGAIYDAEHGDYDLAVSTVMIALRKLSQYDPEQFPSTLLSSFTPGFNN